MQHKKYKDLSEKSVADLAKIANDLNLLDDPTIRNCLRALALRDDPISRHSFESRLKTEIVRNELLPYPFKNPSLNEAKGDFNFATVYDPTGRTHIPFGLYLKEIPKNIYIAGQVGSGKTNIHYHILDGLNKEGIHWFSLDWKGDYKHLLREKDDVLVFPWESFKFNPLVPPPGVRIETWLCTFSEVFARSLGLLIASEGYTLSVVSELYRIYPPGQYPCLLDLFDLLKTKRFHIMSRDSRYLEATRSRVQGLVLSMGGTLNYSKGYPIEELLKHNVVLELNGLPADHANFLASCILSWIFSYRINSGQRGIIPDVVLVFDEGMRFYHRNFEKRIYEGENTILQLTSMIREFKTGLLVSTTQPNQTAECIASNSYTKILLSLGHGPDILDFARSMGLKREQIDFYLNHMIADPGAAIVKLSGRYPLPFCIRVPLYEIVKDVTDEQVEMYMKPILERLPFIPRIKLADVIRIKLEKIKEGTEQDKTSIPEPSGQLRSFLFDAHNRPFITLTNRYEGLMLSASKGQRIKTEALNHGLIREVHIPTKRGHDITLLELTMGGYEYLGIRYDDNLKGKGGLAHRYWAYKVKEYMENKGYKASIEKNIAGKLVDVFVETPQERWAFEIQLSLRHAIENIQKDFAAGIDKIYIGCDKRNILNTVNREIEEKISNDKKERIHTVLLTDFFN